MDSSSSLSLLSTRRAAPVLVAMVTQDEPSHATEGCRKTERGGESESETWSPEGLQVLWFSLAYSKEL